MNTCWILHWGDQGFDPWRTMKLRTRYMWTADRPASMRFARRRRACWCIWFYILHCGMQKVSAHPDHVARTTVDDKGTFGKLGLPLRAIETLQLAAHVMDRRGSTWSKISSVLALNGTGASGRTERKRERKRERVREGDTERERNKGRGAETTLETRLVASSIILWCFFERWQTSLALATNFSLQVSPALRHDCAS